MNNGLNRCSPEAAMEKAIKEQRGTLKIFLGYAPGVGKTFSMLNEGNRRLSRGQNIVIGYIETHGRKETIEQIKDLKIIPRKKINYNGISVEEMDTDEIISVHPHTVIIDELAHTNVPGSKNLKRYEDIEAILASGINVISTLNIQHLESLNDVIKQITGITVKETIPDKIVEEADEVVIVDLTPDALQSRLKRGSVYKAENVENALKNFFRKGNLNALREIALRLAAEEVDEDLEEYMKEHGIKDNWYTAERVLVCISSAPSAKKLIRRGFRISKRYKCEWLVVFVECTHIFAPKLTQKNRDDVENYFKMATQLGAEVVSLSGKSVSEELTNFAGSRHITQIIVGHNSRSTLQLLLRGSTVSKLLRNNKGTEIHVIPYDL